MKIHRITIGAVGIGASITNVDDDDLTTDAAINEAYTAADQDWQTVVTTKGHADIGQVLLRQHDGSSYWSPVTSWGAWTWQLVDDDGYPVIDQDAVDAWRS